MSILDLVIATTIIVTLVTTLINAYKDLFTKIPAKLGKWLLGLVTVSVTTEKGDAIFREFQKWLILHPYSNKVRNAKYIWFWDKEQNINTRKPLPNYGYHFLWLKGKF